MSAFKPPRKSPYSPAFELLRPHQQEIQQAWLSGVPCSSLAKRYGLPNETFHRAIRKLGMVLNHAERRTIKRSEVSVVIHEEPGWMMLNLAKNDRSSTT